MGYFIYDVRLKLRPRGGWVKSFTVVRPLTSLVAFGPVYGFRAGGSARWSTAAPDK
jgi:hypothetical protein